MYIIHIFAVKMILSTVSDIDYGIREETSHCRLHLLPFRLCKRPGHASDAFRNKSTKCLFIACWKKYQRMYHFINLKLGAKVQLRYSPQARTFLNYVVSLNVIPPGIFRGCLIPGEGAVI